jgi:hypothetical protein
LRHIRAAFWCTLLISHIAETSTALQTKASAQFCGGVRGKLNAVRAERIIAGSERKREKRKNIARALNVGAPIAVMHATIISTRCERLNITTRIHAQHLQHHPTSVGGARSTSVNYIPETPSAINLGGGEQ